jgi:NAD+ synthase
MSAGLAPDVLALDAAAEVDRIAAEVRRVVGRTLHRRGAVVGVSGGVDSAVCVALAVRSLGPERVLALLMPEADSDPDATARAARLCDQLGVEHLVEDIAPTLDALGCYRRRDDAIRRLFPGYGDGWRSKIRLASGASDGRDRVSTFELVVADPGGAQQVQRMPADVYLAVVAATNMKQRTRKLLEYHHAEARNLAVVGTPNRLEYELGFFVRGGDGLADLKPVAHLYKTQVYDLAAQLDVPEEIRAQPPSTDTFSLPQTQEEFYFTLPYAQMDLALWAWNHDVPPEAAATTLGLTADQVTQVYRDVEGKRRTAARSLADAHLVPDGGDP